MAYHLARNACGHEHSKEDRSEVRGVLGTGVAVYTVEVGVFEGRF